jgi:uncharacterized membrane protein YraQ (UPF0718 family)
LGGLGVYSPDQAIATARYVARELAEIGPWLVSSVCIAAAARATGLDQLAAKAFKGRESRMIIVASVIGAALPFCSCGVIPLVAGLLGAGVPLAPVMAFWISSPLMDPTQFFIASGVLGIGFASAKMLSAVGMGMLSGFGTMMLVRAGWLDAAGHASDHGHVGRRLLRIKTGRHCLTASEVVLRLCQGSV